MVTPKPGVFIADVKHLLILTTAVEIVVLGVTFGTATALSSPGRVLADEMQLLNKPIFVINTDNVSINAIQGTKDGRIFLGGRDGNLYEINYQAESSWFGKRCRKTNHSQGLSSYVPGFLKIFSVSKPQSNSLVLLISFLISQEIDPIMKLVVDDSRGLLYALTEKGTVEAWELTENDNIRRIARLTTNDITYMASNILKTVEASIFKPVTALCALEMSDSYNVNLIAVTHAGVRFYLTTSPLTVNNMNQSNPVHESSRNQGLYLSHVRLPPGYTPNATGGKPKQVHGAFYKHGAFLMVSTAQPDLDELWSVSSEPFPMRPFLVESSTVLQLDGQVWAIGEIKTRKSNTFDSLIKTAQTPRKVVILTNQGAHIVALLKPADFLRQLLISCHGAHHDAIKAFFSTQTEPYACATSLDLACLEQIRNAEMGQWATQAFMLYGGEPHFALPQQQQHQQHHIGSPFNQNRSFNNSTTFMEAGPPIFMSTPFPTTRPASSVQQSLMQQTQFPTSQNQSQQNPTLQPEQTNLSYSAKHAGLYLHVSRLLRPIWRRRCIDQKMASTINSDDCSEVMNDLHAIKSFLEINSVSHLSANSARMNGINASTFVTAMSFNQQQQTASRKSAEDALVEEKKSLDALNRFIRHTAEVVGLWKIMCEHQFNILLSQLPKDLLNILSACTFRDLIMSRIDICAQLIVILINTYLNDSASINSISSKLRDVCPTLYRHEDAVSHKATEILMLSKNCTDLDEKEERLRTALQLCKGAAPRLPLANICQQFAMAGFYQGVIDLCVTCAAKIDSTTMDYEIYAARNKCYKVVCDMLESVYQNLRNANTTIEMTRGLPMDEERERNINQKIFQIVGMALQTSDKALHHAIYEWLLAHDLLSELLGVTEPSLGEFLSRSSEQAPENLKISDLLWKYHERNGQHAAAARILYSLASSDTDRIDLQQRIEYLARAIMCMRSDSVGCSAHNGVLLKELEDKVNRKISFEPQI